MERQRRQMELRLLQQQRHFDRSPSPSPPSPSLCLLLVPPRLQSPIRKGRAHRGFLLLPPSREKGRQKRAMREEEREKKAEETIRSLPSLRFCFFLYSGLPFFALIFFLPPLKEHPFSIRLLLEETGTLSSSKTSIH